MRSSPGCRRGSGARPAPRCRAGPRAPRSGSSRAASSLASSPEPPLPGPLRTREETPRGLVSPARRCPRALTSQAAVASRAPSAPARKDGPRRAGSRPHPTAPVTPALRGRLGRSCGRTEHPPHSVPEPPRRHPARSSRSQHRPSLPRTCTRPGGLAACPAFPSRLVSGEKTWWGGGVPEKPRPRELERGEE